MDNKMAQRIRNFSTWEDLQQFEKNARDRKQLTEEMADAIKDRGADLGMLLIAEKTGLDVTDLSPAEKKIVRAVSEYVGVMKQLGKYPGRTLEQLRNRGLIDAAEIAVCRAKPTQGYQTLSDAGLEELSYERIVLEHQEEFSPRAVWFSRRTLGLPNETETAPTPTHSDIQTRTSTLLSWLKNEAANNEGVIPSYSNADAAEVMGIGDMRRYGQVHGNIQSRIDFACYLAGLPPLGLSADAPFSKAWSTENRDWQFPIADMQAVAQSRVWSAAEFDRILRATEGLPGQAHIFWKEELVSRVAKIKDWAYSYLGSASVERPPRKDVNGVRRNPPWARDELILALDLYLNYRAKPLAKDSAEIVELSGFLNKMGRAMGLVDMDTFRNPNGVYMKMMNFRRFDPEYTGDGKVAYFSVRNQRFQRHDQSFQRS